MDYASTIPYRNEREETCGDCGAEYQVIITKQTSHNEKEEYSCPECGKEYHTRASMPISVILKNKRTDGK